MELARVTSKGQITIPKDIREKLKLKPGDKVIFLEEDDRIIFANSSVIALKNIQKQLADEAKKAGIETEEDVEKLINEIRKELWESKYENNDWYEYNSIAILFPNSKLSLLIWDITEKHELVLCSHIIEELHIVFERKFKDKIKCLDDFLSELTYELIYTPKKIDISNYPSIRDPKDLPILISAINNNIDIFITGDKDFQDIKIDIPVIKTPNDYLINRTNRLHITICSRTPLCQPSRRLH